MKHQGLVLTLCAIAGLVAGGGLVASRTLPDTRIIVETPVLESFRPNEKRLVSLTLRNRSLFSIPLGEPEFSCGCMSAGETSATVVPALGTATVQFFVTASGSPGTVGRSMTLHGRNGKSAWPVSISVTVEAEVWSAPGTLAIEYDLPNEIGSWPTLQVCRTSNSPPIIVKSRVPQLIVASRVIESGNLSVECRIAPEAAGRLATGSSEIEVSDRDSRELKLVIPVTWKPRSRAKFFPKSLTLEKIDTDAGSLQRQVSLFVQGEPKNIHLQPLVDWAEPTIESVSPFGGVVTILFDTMRMPVEFDRPVFRLTIPGDPVVYDYRVVSRK